MFLNPLRSRRYGDPAGALRKPDLPDALELSFVIRNCVHVTVAPNPRFAGALPGSHYWWSTRAGSYTISPFVVPERPFRARVRWKKIDLGDPTHPTLSHRSMLGTLARFASLLLGVGLPLSSGCSEAGGGDPAIEERVERPDFPGDEAHRLLREQVAFGPRIPGQVGHQRQLEWMRKLLEERADTLVIQPFSATTSGGATLQLTNLFARFRPEQTDRILLIAHWDTRPRADQSTESADREKPVPGANDGASGTAILLQLAEVLRQAPPPLGVDILLVDGEDFGPGTDDMFFGSRHFAANLPSGYRPLYGVLLDMVGDRDLRIPVEGYSAEKAPEVVQRVWAVARDLGYGEVFVNTPGGYVSDDHVPLNDAGIRTIDIIDFEYGPGNRFWHTLADAPENTAPESLDIVGEVVTELVYRGG